MSFNALGRGIRIEIVLCGEPDGWAVDAVEHWRRRISSLAQLKMVFLRHRSSSKLQDALRAQTSGHSVAMTRSGNMLSTDDWAKFLRDVAEGGGYVKYLIGGADGLPVDVISACRWKVSLAPITLQHDVALIVLLEQIYRALSINAGLPYHRAGGGA